MNLNKFCYIFAFCIKQTRNQDLTKPEIILFYDNIGEKPIIRLGFDFDKTLVNNVKTIKGIYWNQSHKFWYIPKEEFKLSEIFNIVKPFAYLNYSALRNTAAEIKPKKDRNKVVPKPKVKLPEKYVIYWNKNAIAKTQYLFIKVISLILSYISMIKIWQKFQKKLSITIS